MAEETEVVDPVVDLGFEYKDLWVVDLNEMEEVDDSKVTIKYQINDNEPEMEGETALAVLLLDRVVFMNANWWKKTWPEDAKKMASIFVNCNDVFVWGSADAEELPYKELDNLYEHYHQDKSWGPAVWCIKQRGYMPQEPVYDAIQALDIWDLNTMNLEISIDDRVQKRKHEEEAQIQTSHVSFFKKINTKMKVNFTKLWKEG